MIEVRLAAVLLSLLLASPALAREAGQRSPDSPRGPYATLDLSLGLGTGSSTGETEPQHVRDPNGTWVGSPESLCCFFYQAVYFDVPVPPLQYQVITGDGSTVIETVTFGGPGEKKTVKIWKIMVGYTVAA